LTSPKPHLIASSQKQPLTNVLGTQNKEPPCEPLYIDDQEDAIDFFYQLPEEVIESASIHPGWSALSWWRRLSTMAANCDNTYRATALAWAANVMVCQGPPGCSENQDDPPN